MNNEELKEKLRVVINSSDSAEDSLLDAIILLRQMRTDALADLEELEND